jgi:hypothetical protein
LTGARNIDEDILTILVGIKCAVAIGRATGNEEASIAVSVAAPHRDFHPIDEIRAGRIGVVVDLDLLSWADSKEDSQICKAEKLHIDVFDMLSRDVTKQQQHKGHFSRRTVGLSRYCSCKTGWRENSTQDNSGYSFDG